MIVIIAGSRNITDCAEVEKAVVESGFDIKTVISGTAQGADRLGERWAKRHDVRLIRIPANWTKFGRSAGHKRNAVMAKRGDALIALWDGKSKGTEGMINLMRRASKPYYIHLVK